LANITAVSQQNYDSFVWLELSEADFAKLQASGVAYQLLTDPFTLTLGEQRFDPLRQTGAASGAWGVASGHNGADLHLVQFTGPTKADWLDTLTSNGLEIVQYIHPYTYVVWGSNSQLQRLANLTMVRWMAPFLPAYRVLPQWRQLSAQSVQVDVLMYRGADTDSVVSQLEALGSANLRRTVLNQTWEISGLFLPGDQLLTAAQIPGVYSIQPIPTNGGLRGEMSNQINANNHNVSNQAFPGYQAWLNAAGVDGSGVVIANVDGGVQESHADLVNRFIACTGDSCGNGASSSHGTHTAGIMAADGASGITDAFGFLRGQGMAPAANLVEQVYFPSFTLPGGMLLLMTDSYNNGASLSGNSWGPSGSPLGYDDDTLQVDIGVRDADPDTAGNQPLSYVLSFMNGSGGASSQGTPDEAKNIFTIGSTKMQNGSGTQILDIDDLSFNSAHGPALDGRTIPHMVAPGCEVDSTVPTGYSLECGTSMASPHVSGAVALFIEYYRGLYGVDPSPALVKAAFLPVAHDLAGNLDADGGTLGHPFDSKQGWGRMDVAAVVSPTMDTLYFDGPVILDNTGEEWLQTVFPADPTQPVRLMLVWTDAPGHGLGGSTPAWNNDLNLVVEAGGDSYYGNDFDASGWSQSGGSPDSMNNSEGIFLGPTPPGSMTIRVSANNINSDGIPNQGDTTDQDFALACVNCAQATDFAVIASPTPLEVCVPNPAVYDVNVTAISGYSQVVNLSAVNNPSGTTAAFSVNGQPAPYTSTLTISDTTAAVSGIYDIDIVGMGPTSTHTTTVQLHLCAPEIAVAPTSLNSAQEPDTVVTHTLTISNVGTGQLNWNIIEQNESTFLEAVTVATYPETAESATNLTPNMQAFLQDKEPVQNLQPLGATPCIGNMAGSYPCNNIDLISFLPLGSIGGGEGNDIWGWTGCSGREFALMGRTNGTAFVEITDPANPIYVGNLPSHTGNSIWRDIKTYADHAFIVSEAGSHGMQVFDLTQLCSIAIPPVTFGETTHYDDFGSAHNLVINEGSGYAYGVGTNSCSGGLHMVNIQNPLNPTNAGCFSTDGYTHDAQCVNYHGPDTEHQGKEICFNSNTDTLTIVDVTNKATPAQLSRTGYAGSGYTHQGWLTEDQAYFLLDDEADETGFGHNTRTYIWDLADLDNPLLIDNYTASTAAIDHNLYIKGNYAFQANYRAGLRILDIQDIANGNLFEEAYFDIYPSSDSASFNGAWSTYPYFDSGVVIVSGIEQGLFVLQPTTLPGACTSPSDVPWLAVSPDSGATAENSSTPITVSFDSTGLIPGEYTALLCISSNALTTPEIQAPITLTVNHAPVAVDDSYTTTQEVALAVVAPGVLDNDSDGDSDGLTAVLDTGPSNGSLSFNADGSFIYTPTVAFDGSDSFTYRADDGANSSNVATVTINVLNTAPVAADDSYIVATDTVLSVPLPGVLANDSDDNGDSLTAVLDSDVSHGSLSLNADGSFTYTPHTGFTGIVTFTYHANDGTDDSNVATVTINVGGVVQIFLPFVGNDG
jgi:choice-of-anchor B domain-containing protein